MRGSDAGWQAGKREVGDQLKGYRDPLVSHRWPSAEGWQWRWTEVNVMMYI